jgi:hypothetical protein
VPCDHLLLDMGASSVYSAVGTKSYVRKVHSLQSCDIK